MSTLFIDLIPRSAWFLNLRSELTFDEWDLVKKKTYQNAHYLCQICGGKGAEHPVECHERWGFDSKRKIQKLISTIALCPACHETTHFGLANERGRFVEARAHLIKVNRWSDNVADQHIREAFTLWESRSKDKWILDATWLLSFVALSETTIERILQYQVHYN